MAPISRSLEITVISAEDLRRNRKSLKKKSFATVKIDSQNSGTTKIDERGGAYPFWNHKLALNLPPNVSFLTVNLYSGSFTTNEIVGTANVPVSDFLGGYVPETYLHFLSYRLRDLRGERNGIVNISVRVLVSDVDYISPSRKLQIPAEQSYIGGGIAIGIPVLRGQHI